MIVTNDGKCVMAAYPGLFRLNGDARPVVAWTPNPGGQGWRLFTPAITGDSYRLQVTRDLLAWETVQTQVATGCSVEFLVGTDGSPQFYRIERVPAL